MGNRCEIGNRRELNQKMTGELLRVLIAALNKSGPNLNHANILEIMLRTVPISVGFQNWFHFEDPSSDPNFIMEVLTTESCL
jgi:hypothetical protein